MARANVRKAATTMTRRGQVIAIRAICFSNVCSSVRTNLIRSANCRSLWDTVKAGGLFNHGMWPRSHCTRRCRPTAFAGHHRRWRSYSKGSDSSERYSRSSPGGALSCMWIRRWLTLEEALNMLQRWCVERRRRKPNWRAAIGTPPEGLGKMDVSCTSWLLRTRPRSAAAVGGVRRVQTARRPLGAARAQPRTGIA